MRRLALPLAAAAAVAGSLAEATEQPGWRLLGRNYFLHSDTRTGPAQAGYRQEWAQGLIAELRSGFTPGPLGLGVDAQGFVGLKLDGGRGHAGTGLLPRDSAGRAEREYASAGAALKLRYGESLLKAGEMRVATPVFATADKRLQPEYATGLMLDSPLSPSLQLQAGRFTAFKNQASSTGRDDFSGYGASTRGSGISLLGTRFSPPGPFSAALYAAQLDDTWRQAYLNLKLQEGALSLDAHLYRTRDQGAASAGSIDTQAYSLAAGYRFGAQHLMLAYQRIEGDTPFDFVGGDSIYLANAIKYADFNGANERSWQLRYDLDMTSLGISGLSLMARYVTGRGIDGSQAPKGGAYNPYDGRSGRYVPQQGVDGRHWERDVELRYQVPSGSAKDLSISLAHVAHRANAAQAGDDIDRLYLVIEYPIDGAF